MKTICCLLILLFPLLSRGNDFAKSLAENFEKTKCKIAKPSDFGNKIPLSGKESCHVFENSLYVEHEIGLHTIEALRENEIKRVYLNSVGGSVSFAISAAEIIRKKR